jgi:hypothetical protein
MNSAERLRLSDLRHPNGMDKERYIHALYRVALQRTPNPNDLSRLLARDDVDNFFPEILSSAEFRRLARSPAYAAARALHSPNPPRVLLFGAYGNGNIGDAIQASSLARAINSLRPEIEVWACSAMPAPYPFAHELTLQGDAIVNPAIVNSFDLLAIGGGGLLSHPHDPLTDPKWQAMLQVPVALIGVGAAAAAAGRSEILIRKAIYASGRDDPSITTLRRFRDDVDFVPDPVLCDAHYLSTSDVTVFPPSSSERRLWVLRYVDTENFTQLCDRLRGSADRVCFIEPHLDFQIVQKLPNAIPIYRVEDLISMIDGADLVLSMRYHGCILAMLRGKRVFGLFERKCCDLMERYGNSQWFSAALSNPADLTAPYVSVGSKLSQDRITFLRGLQKVLSDVRAPRNGDAA